jgi:hypothetical protein
MLLKNGFFLTFGGPRLGGRGLSGFLPERETAPVGTEIPKKKEAAVQSLNLHHAQLVKKKGKGHIISVFKPSYDPILTELT